MQENKITATQVFWISITIILGTIILIVPRVIVQHGKQSGWIAILIAGFSIGVIHYIVLKLSCNFSQQSILWDFQKIFGSYLGRILILPYMLMIIEINIYLLIQSTSLIGAVMPEMPMVSLWIGISILASYLVYTGIETIARVNKIGIIIMVLSIIIILGFNLKESLAGVNNLRPILVNPKNMVKAAIIPAHWFILIPVILLVFKPFFKDNNRVIKASLAANLSCQLIIILLVVTAVSVLGVNLTTTLAFPFYNLSRLPISGLEIIIFVAWITGAIIKIAIFYYSFIKLLANWCELQDYKVLISPVAILITALTMYSTQMSLVSQTLKYAVTGFLLLIELPTLLLLSLGYLLATND
ncbi:GerAB/ArcD/ProY family transporter [Halanaerobaculum tunisiense]